MSTDPVIRRKLARLRGGHPPRFMDLFAGCGGLSLGFVTAACESIASVECDQFAAMSHGVNFAPLSRGSNQQAYQRARDIIREDASDIFSDLELTGPVNDQVDILVGGPPCQAFARVGRAKLREQAKRRGEATADQAFVVDGRVSLWRRYVAYIRQTRPVALMMENVPDILNHAGVNMASLVARELEEEGYVIRYTLLNSSWYGVPQIRERMILIGIHNEANAEPVFPSPTHYVQLPRGYDGTRSTARKVITEEGAPHHRVVDNPTVDLPPTTTASQALADLPKIFAIDLLRRGLLKRGEKSPALPTPYTEAEPTTAWSRLMRRWPGFSTTDQSTGHVIRYLPRDYKTFRIMGEGWEYPEIHAEVERRIAKWLDGRRRSGLPTSDSNPDVAEYMTAWRIPYDPKKFPNKWWKLHRDRPVRTLMAHLGKDSYSHIHYDSQQARTISIREAARLQSFPDGFVFKGSGNPALRQIGNAVPPLFAYALAVALRQSLGCAPIHDIRCAFLGVRASTIITTMGHI